MMEPAHNFDLDTINSLLAFHLQDNAYSTNIHNEEEDEVNTKPEIDPCSPDADSKVHQPDAELEHFDLMKLDPDNYCDYDPIRGPSIRPATESTYLKQQPRRDCHVCDSPAGRHNYYGGQVCESCRAFFRRTVQNETVSVYKCKANENCVIDSKSRKSCASCRYKKCIAAGMNPKWLMTEKEKRKKRERFALVSYQFQPSSGLSMPFTTEESLKMRQMTHSIKYCGYDLLSDIFSRDPRTPNQIFRIIFHDIKNDDPMLLKEIEAHERERFLGICYRIEDIDSIPREERHKLIRHNFPLYFALWLALYFGENDFDFHYSEYREYIRSEKRTTVPHVIDIFDKLQKNNKKLKLKYEQFYISPWAPSLDIEERHRKLTRQICAWPRLDGDTHFNETLFLLCILNFMFSTTGLHKLESLPQIEQIQQHYAMMLYRYLKTYAPKHCASKFAKGLMLPVLAREMYDLHCQMLPI